MDIARPAPAHHPPETGWAAVPHPAVVVDRAGTVVAHSGAARTVLPAVAVDRRWCDVAPGWLTRAHDDTIEIDAADDRFAPVSGDLDGRVLEARPTRQADGSLAWWLIEDGTAALREALRQERERTAFLAETSDILLSSLNVERCMAATVRMAARHLADAAVLVAPATGPRLPITSCYSDVVHHRAVQHDPGVVAGLAEALRGFPPVPSRWIDPATVPDWLIPEGFPGSVGSVVITPLPGHGVSAGALILLRRNGEQVFSARDETFAQLFAARAGSALSAARLYADQAAVTGLLMHELLPPRLRRVHGIELAGGYRASENHELVGGDFYDVHPAPTPDGETLIALGDVCGKGLEAAVLTGKIRNTLQALAPLADDHERMLNLLNNALLSSADTRFATIVLASATRDHAGVRLRLTSGGHLPPLIVRADGTVETADTRGQLVGVLPSVTATTVHATLAPGETCLLYTDGVTEARGGPLGDDMFGEHRLAAALADCAGMPADAVVEHIRMRNAQWLGPHQHDDVAVVAITAPRHSHLSAVDGHTHGRYTA
ncbi:SpoIIE family protein phosphatase [Nocardia blacklockiae]|nr:SpoIIE family protein phosphatase [Nocardia blacklockiae]